jgi:hypothetical protein
MPKYVALGDSYSAGQFLGGDANLVRQPIDGGLGGPDGDYTGRSLISYPQQLHQGVLEGWDFVDATAGGATIDGRGLAGVGGGILEEQTGFGGPPYIPVDPLGTPSFTATPRRAQIEELTRDTTVVTVGIGGNVYNLGQIIAKCATLGADPSAGTSPGKDYYESHVGSEDLLQKKEDLVDGFRKMMPLLVKAAPEARFFFIGYPTVFPRDPGGCDFSLENLTIRRGDLPFIQDQFDQVDSVIREFAAAEPRATYVDIAESSLNHHACRPRADSWMFGLVGEYLFDDELEGYKPKPFVPLTPEFSPAWTAAILGLLAATNHTMTTFHPNERGANNQTVQVVKALQGAGIVP